MYIIGSDSDFPLLQLPFGWTLPWLEIWQENSRGKKTFFFEFRSGDTLHWITHDKMWLPPFPADLGDQENLLPTSPPTHLVTQVFHTGHPQIQPPAFWQEGFLQGSTQTMELPATNGYVIGFNLQYELWLLHTLLSHLAWKYIFILVWSRVNNVCTWIKFFWHQSNAMTTSRS